MNNPFLREDGESIEHHQSRLNSTKFNHNLVKHVGLDQILK